MTLHIQILNSIMSSIETVRRIVQCVTPDQHRESLSENSCGALSPAAFITIYENSQCRMSPTCTDSTRTSLR